MATWTARLSQTTRKAARGLAGAGLWPVRGGPATLALLACPSVWRLPCPVPSRSPSANNFFQRWRAQADPHDVARQFGVSLRSVQRLFARFAQWGDDGIAPDYAACGQQQAVVTPAALVEQFCQTRREHPRWGSEMIRLELAVQHEALPCARTIRRHLHQAGLQPAPAGRSEEHTSE